ncbi:MULTISPECIES: nitroreductase family protein [Butyricimonas]|uniref:nitroreductase family protein n=1 Tax=Butyricimonas TaxID=574697 RepID=UPI001D0814C2|nr:MULTISPECIES: nitroreductase family protein [Butyricimonas]MCB6973635.1 nitroreductase family protein [Butyricimonas synergistica]MCG4520446.1 nitroreductase family protein [Butyricimonas sp. DFI.6.44]
MKKFNTFYVLLAVVLVIVFLKTSCMGDAKQQDDPVLKTKAVLENIAARKSVRKYLKKEVEEEKITAMLKAGMAAPSGMDRRPWEFVVVTDRAALDSMAASLPYAKMLAQAPMAIVVCGDSTRSSYWYVDCSAVTQNILLAAEALGLGAVWTAAYPYEDRIGVVRKYTAMPEQFVPLCIIPVGYPDGPQKAKDKYDESKIHRNKF